MLIICLYVCVSVFLCVSVQGLGRDVLHVLETSGCVSVVGTALAARRCV